ncbi:polysaccharide pyruvyl transferase family protein [Pseudomonas sp. B21-015]|uniref:polysaccharide pyruvyl transferase family protein n=1 Tax=Pseudomonas sp. B21-015 TaxID=2895473 RepID=UPI00215F5D27|nr:polysaccharide pyruvyl transferase family protein [Pseudomonas sp. B21-015]UVM48516.1 polysaccharide pyruvyl transferase family protein [Pseudomonas sp. B21-015]
MNVSIIGYYGDNFGDLLMLKSLLSLKKPGAVFTVLTYGDGQSLRKQNFISDNDVGVVELNKANTLAAYRKVINSSAIIWGGGTCFMDEGGTGGIKYMALARLFGANVIYAGIGVDNHKKMKTRLILFLATLIAKALYIRDSASLQAVKKINPWMRSGKIKQSVDLAYALDIGDVEGAGDLEGADNYIILCLRDLEGYGEQSSGDIYRQLLGVSIKACIALGVNRIGVLNADAEVDAGVSLYAERELEDCGFSVFKIPGSDIDRSIDCIKNARHVISARLHPAVVAYSVGTPFSLYNYSDKNKKFTAETHTDECLIHRGAINRFVPQYKIGSAGEKSTHRQLAQSTVHEIYQLLN